MFFASSSFKESSVEVLINLYSPTPYH